MCVNFTAGDSKPEIRVANTYTYFNITNFAQFENITFSSTFTETPIKQEFPV